MERIKDYVKKFKRNMNGLRLQYSKIQINRRIREKLRNKEKIKVLFVCHRPAVWESLHSVYDALKQDERFDPMIVAIPNKKELPGVWLNHEEYETEGAEQFWKDYDCINGYDYQTKQWVDLKKYKPDYLFFQQPYNVARCAMYHSKVVSRYAKIAYVAYYSPIVYDEVYVDCTPADFLNDLSFFFTQNDKDHAFIQKRFNDIGSHHCQIINTGFPRYDNVLRYRGSTCDLWKRSDSYKMIWTPRWTTNEGNCNFFAYKDLLVEYCRKNADVELAFRPHPQAFMEWESTGELTKEDREEYLQNYRGSNMHIDDSEDYFPLLFSADCLISDRSTMISDFLCTGKPVIYCMNDRNGNLDSDFFSVVYTVRSWTELEQRIWKLRQGEDPLFDKRTNFVRDFMKIGQGRASDQIVKVLFDDACSAAR